MNWDHMAHRWADMKETVRERWDALTDDDLDVVAGERVHLVTILQQRYDATHEAIEAQVKEFEKEMDDAEQFDEEDEEEEDEDDADKRPGRRQRHQPA
ncbi:MAG TPA: hypothetical protein VH833_09995 [Gemmatimonadales bacterium]